MLLHESLFGARQTPSHVFTTTGQVVVIGAGSLWEVVCDDSQTVPSFDE